MGPCSSYCVTSFSIDVMVCAWSHCSMLCHGSWISVGGLLLPEPKCRDGGSGGEERQGGETGGREGWEIVVGM